MVSKWFFAASLVVAGLANPGLAADTHAVDTHPAETAEVEATLNTFHQLAAKADAKYFDLFAPEGVFIGTDATERWDVAAFKKYAEPHFAKGHGWSYEPKSRHVDFSPTKELAWFDEILLNKSYGTCRGSGVLRKIEGKWRISQYHLTIPIPNDLADQVVKLIATKK